MNKKQKRDKVKARRFYQHVNVLLRKAYLGFKSFDGISQQKMTFDKVAIGKFTTKEIEFMLNMKAMTQHEGTNEELIGLLRFEFSERMLLREKLGN